MDYAISILEDQREQMVSRLKDGDKACLSQLQSIDRALHWLKLVHKNGLDEFRDYKITQLPFIEGYGDDAYYRIMVDNASGEADWEEFELNGKKFLLTGMDFIIEFK